MNRYAARVELNGPPGVQKYLQLEDAMRRVGFLKEIRADDGVFYRLPHAVYVADGPVIDATKVHDLVARTVAAVWRSNEVIVFRYDEAAWSGLQPVGRKQAA